MHLLVNFSLICIFQKFVNFWVPQTTLAVYETNLAQIRQPKIARCMCMVFLIEIIGAALQQALIITQFFGAAVQQLQYR